MWIIQVVSGQFGQPFGNPPVPFGPFGPVPPNFDDTTERYQPGKCLNPNVTSNLQEFARTYIV